MVCWLLSCFLLRVFRSQRRDRGAPLVCGPVWCHRNTMHLPPEGRQQGLSQETNDWTLRLKSVFRAARDQTARGHFKNQLNVAHFIQNKDIQLERIQFRKLHLYPKGNWRQSPQAILQGTMMPKWNCDLMLYMQPNCPGGLIQLVSLLERQQWIIGDAAAGIPKLNKYEPTTQMLDLACSSALTR